MKLLLVDTEEQNSSRVSSQLRSKCQDWSVLTTTTGQHALELLESEEVSVVVTDLQLPGMHGTELLERVAQRHPRVLRVAVSAQVVDANASYISTIHQYLPQRYEVDDLIGIVQTNQRQKPEINREDVLEAIGRKGCLPSIPDNLVKLNEALDSEDTNLALIAQIVSEDPSLAAKILQLANSAIFGLRYPVKDIARGVSVVGKSTVRAIAVSNAIFSVAQYDSLLSPDRLFDHCFEVAETARALCQLLGVDSLDRQCVISAALLHDVGKVVLVNAFPDEYESILGDKEDERPMWEKEQGCIGVGHQCVGEYLLSSWGIPEEITRLIKSHHDLPGCATGDTLMQLVFAANWLTNNADESILAPFLTELDVPTDCAEFAQLLLGWRNRLADED